MPKPTGPTPVQLQLARDLFAAGLAPTGVTQLDCLDGPAWYYESGGQWRPRRSWDAVAHLVERYTVSFYTDELFIGNDNDGERLAHFRDFPAAICRLALRLHAAQQEAGNADFTHDTKENISG